MRELSQKTITKVPEKKRNPCYKLMWKVECELNQKLQAELREKDLEIEEMKDRLKYEVKMIEGAANDEIHLLNHNIERLINMNKIMREALEFVKDALDGERINLGMIKAIDACVFHALEKVDQSTEIGS